MRRDVIAVLVVCACSAFPLVARAQACVGAASFKSGPVRIGAGLTVGDNVKTYGAQIAAGAAMGPFASLDIGRSEFDDVSDAGTVFGATAGYAIDLTPEKTVQFCPLVSYSYLSGPEIFTVSTSAHAFQMGGSFGGLLSLSPTLDFVPFVGASYVNAKATFELNGNSASDSNDYGQAKVGAGFVVNRQLTLQPSVAIPFGLDGGKSSFTLAFAYTFGSSAKR